ncbi:hypothetical protein LKO26_12005 [Chryseobacterium sp. MFBS3-17]|nr:hypothetical protein [Chryseobacterium sp. MFBS3-17]
MNHHQIDFEKYSACLKKAANYSVYAETWYLDAQTNKLWDCLVLRDYEAVMPLPLIRKFGVKIVSQPIFCQQLGIFFSEEPSELLFRRFIAAFRKTNVLSYHFNESNFQFSLQNAVSRHNYLLPLKEDYDKIFHNYRRDRKKDIRRMDNENFTITDIFHEEEIFKELLAKYPYMIEFYGSESFQNLIREVKNRKLYTFYALRSENNLIASILLLHSGNKRILLLSTRSSKHKGAFAWLLDYFIKNNSNSELVLDFEGSMVPNIADFNKSFGAILFKYYAIQHTRRRLFFNFINFARNI